MRTSPWTGRESTHFADKQSKLSADRPKKLLDTEEFFI